MLGEACRRCHRAEFLVHGNNLGVYDAVTWLHPDLSREPPFDLAAL